MTSRQRSVYGFTMIEIMLVILIIGALSVAATGYLLNFRQEARKSAAKNFINYLQSSLQTKKAQMAISCGADSKWPRFQAILKNDITEDGVPEAACRSDQIPNPIDRKFMTSGGSPLTVPVNPNNGLSSFVECSCHSRCDPFCYRGAGFCYNQDTGMIWGQGLSNCPDEP